MSERQSLAGMDSMRQEIIGLLNIIEKKTRNYSPEKPPQSVRSLGDRGLLSSNKGLRAALKESTEKCEQLENENFRLRSQQTLLKQRLETRKVLLTTHCKCNTKKYIQQISELKKDLNFLRADRERIMEDLNSLMNVLKNKLKL